MLIDPSSEDPHIQDYDSDSSLHVLNIIPRLAKLKDMSITIIVT